MRITVRGWSRDHGSTTLIKEDVWSTPIREVDSYNISKLYVEPTMSDEGKVIGVVMTYGRSIRLNGDYMCKFHLSVKDVLYLHWYIVKEYTFSEVKKLTRLFDKE